MKTVHIEAMTSLQILDTMIIPAVLRYSREVAEGAAVKAGIGISADTEKRMAGELSEGLSELVRWRDQLRAACRQEPEELNDRAFYAKEQILPAMEGARKAADALETQVARDLWPMPGYSQMLFYV